MRLALITETFLPDVNGVSKTLGQLCRGLMAKGVEVDLVWPGVNDLTFAELSSWQASGHQLPGYASLKFGWKLPERVKKHWRLNPPDIFYIATEGPLGLSALRYARKRGIPAVTGFHTNFDQYLAHYRLGWLQKSLQLYLRRFHNASTLTLTPSRQQRQELLNQNFQRVELLGRGVDTQLFRPDRRSANFRRKMGIDDEQLLVGYVGRLAGEKNLPLLLKAFAAIRLQKPSARLLLVGNGPWEEEVQRRCPDALLVGCQEGEALANYYANMDLFLFPSRTETYGNVVAEAMASGLPVVAYDRAAAQELIHTGKNGWLLDETSGEQAFIQAAVELAEEEHLRLVMGHLAYQDMQKRGWKEVIERFHQLLTASLHRGFTHEVETLPVRRASQLGRKM
ncbi:glycosyltransferase family 1 protein [Marinospirillum sp.]|uniref:glycosyltransferase family 4 protein n=1 Tax=Marinospirillum sp. TaxID=2183934 RepID=UPI00287009CD|nr:glycosyltransferase family 1 protein [Marinospirillum sp.]MDR9469029.1 glycosyltransferase family 1 protein [Marinospirillum sp.]